MTEIKTSERHLVLNSYKHFDNAQIFYWHNRMSKRLDYLNPLLLEIDKKGLDLQKISPELNREVFEITELIKFLDLFKINN